MQKNQQNSFKKNKVGIKREIESRGEIILQQVFTEKKGYNVAFSFIQMCVCQSVVFAVKRRGYKT